MFVRMGKPCVAVFSIILVLIRARDQELNRLGQFV